MGWMKIDQIFLLTFPVGASLPRDLLIVKRSQRGVYLDVAFAPATYGALEEQAVGDLHHAAATARFCRLDQGGVDRKSVV